MNFFGLEIPDALIYAGAIIYGFVLWLIWNILRRKYPVRVLKLGTGQTATFHKGTEDDLKVHWTEGFFSRFQHEALKLAHSRIIPFWGIFNKVYLARRDWNILIPFARKTSTTKLCGKCSTNFKTEEAITQFETYDAKPFKELLCKNCIEKIPEWIIVQFMVGDELKGSSTEAVTQRENEEFCEEASRVMRKRRKADVITFVLLGAFTGAFLTLVFVMIYNVIKFGA